MKLSYKDWVAIKERTEKELKPLRGTYKEPNAKFSRFEFSWDYYYNYPPGKVRLHYQYKKGNVTGWRTSHPDEAPCVPGRRTLKEENLAIVFNVERLKE